MRSLSLAALLIAAPAFASHEDYGVGARSAGMGDAMTAAGDDPGSIAYNPALASGVTNIEAQTGLRRAYQFPGGSADFNQLEFAAAAPVRSFPWRGALAVQSRNTQLKNVSLDRALGITYATHGWRETDDGVVDWGVSLNSLSRSGSALQGSVSKAGVDIGALYRIHERFVVGASLINLNGPRTDIGGIADRAPVTARLGFSQTSRGFTMALDGVRREPSGGRGPTMSMGAGVERWLHTGLMGALAVRTGLNLGDQSSTWSAGFGWRAVGAQFDYAALAPMTHESRWGHAVSLVFRFGSWNPDKEFERLLGSEIRYRQDLTRSLESAEVKQWKLGEELRRLRRELEDLQAELNSRTAGEADAQQKFRAAREKIRDLEQREAEAQRSLDQLDKDRKALSERSKESLFREDWRAYEKLKSEAAPDLVLLEHIKQLLREYKESGVDLSDANQELRRLLRSSQSP